MPQPAADGSLGTRLLNFGTFALIPIFAFATVLLVPFLSGVMLSFTDWDGVEPIASFDYRWVGIDSYRDAFADSRFGETLRLTALYVLFTVVVTNIVAFGIALLVTSKLKGRNFFRAAYFLPNLIGGVILGFIWQFVFTEIIEWLGDKTGIGLFEFSWLVDTNKAFIALVVVGVWQMSGYMMLIYIAGLISIPSTVIEASSIDGATRSQQVRYVVIPMLIPSFTISIFLTLRNAFMVFDTNLALTDGGPFRSTEMVAMHIYNEAFLFQNYQTAQAKAVVLFLVVATIAVTQVFLTKRREVQL